MNRGPAKGPFGRLSVQLVVSHVLVGVVSLTTTAVLVFLLAPRLFDTMGAGSDEMPGRGLGHGGGVVVGLGALRPEVLSALQAALLWGVVVGVVTAVLLATLAAGRVVKPVTAVRSAANRVAAGDYGTELPRPGTVELSQLVDDVGTMAERLADTEARRVRLLGEVGHEMRTPLTVIDGQVEAMIDGVLPASAENLAVVAAESRRLQRLAADLSALSRAEEGRVNLDRQPANLGELVAGAVERLRPQTDDAGIELRCAPAGGVRVEVDSDRIAQVVTNLVGNAIRATPTGGLITVTCSQEGPEAVVRVCDTGEGIAAPELERVFERFYRVPDRRSTGRESGSGIGLTIARQLAEAHGGSLTAESAGKGLGATFTLRLPAGPRG